MKYFHNITTLDELKKAYRRLAMQYHPDRGGDTATMQEVNAEHDKLFEILKSKHNAEAAKDTTGRTQATTETAAEFRKIIEALLKLDGLEVELCGHWLWISGNTKSHKDQLKAIGCKWSNNKKMWYWRHAEDGCYWHRGKGKEMSEIRSKYGSQKFHGNKEYSEYAKITATV